MNKTDYISLIVKLIGLNILLICLLVTANKEIKGLKYENDLIFTSYQEQLTKVEILEKEKSMYAIAGELYDIEPELLEAIERLETGHFTSLNYKNLMNSWGAYDSKNKVFITYDSHDQSTMELARTLRFHYFDEGLDTIEKISVVFCPNDSEHWAQQVNSIYKSLKGD